MRKRCLKRRGMEGFALEIQLARFIFLTAQAAASRTTWSSSFVSLFKRGKNLGSPLFAMAMTAFLRMPERLARRTGEPRNVS